MACCLSFHQETIHFQIIVISTLPFDTLCYHKAFFGFWIVLKNFDVVANISIILAGLQQHVEIPEQDIRNAGGLTEQTLQVFH